MNIVPVCSSEKKRNIPKLTTPVHDSVSFISQILYFIETLETLLLCKILNDWYLALAEKSVTFSLFHKHRTCHEIEWRARFIKIL